KIRSNTADHLEAATKLLTPLNKPFVQAGYNPPTSSGLPLVKVTLLALTARGTLSPIWWKILLLTESIAGTGGFPEPAPTPLRQSTNVQRLTAMETPLSLLTPPKYAR